MSPVVRQQQTTRLVGLSVWLYAGLAVIMPLMGVRWRRVGAAAEAFDRSERA